MDRQQRNETFHVTIGPVDDLEPKRQRRMVWVRDEVLERTVKDFREFLKARLKSNEVILGAGPELKTEAKG